MEGQRSRTDKRREARLYSRPPFRLLGTPLLIPFLCSLFLAGCASFAHDRPPLLLSQTPDRPPLFILHKPPDTESTAFFIGHARKKGSEESARKIALQKAVDLIAKTYAEKGYVLSGPERSWWLSDAFSRPEGASVVDSWVRVYKESSERPYLHRTSVTLLVAVPRALEKEFLENLRRADRAALAKMDRETAIARASFERGDGSPFLLHLHKAFEESGTIHSLRSFPERSRPAVRQRQASIDALWRESLRDITLTFTASRHPLFLTDDSREIPPLLEKARLEKGESGAGLAGLSATLALIPMTLPEPLVFPPLSWLFGNDHPILSRSVLSWEMRLFKPPSARSSSPFGYRCRATDSKGEGRCMIEKVFVPGKNGTLEAVYQPVPGTRLDTEFFRSLFRKTLLEEHFVFYHKRILHPILLSFGDLPLDQAKTLWPILSGAAVPEGFNFCREAETKGSPSCSRSLPTGLLSLPMPTLRVSLRKESVRTEPHRDFSLTSLVLRVREDLSDRQGVLWRKDAVVQSLGLSYGEARHAAWKEVGRRLAGDLDLFYYRTPITPSGEDFYDR